MTLRPDVTYRAARRNLAKAHKLVWRALERHEHRVMLPRWAWEMPPAKNRQPRWLRRFNQTGRLVIKSRLHEEDPAGHIELSGADYEPLSLPMENPS